jgi:hypothetical protein
MEFFPFILQAVLMSIDEFYCHKRRTLKRWERFGHPLDTFVFIICLVFLLLATPEANAFWIYTVLATVSCLLITKDEWQHKLHCDAFENWLHALLFVLHPVVLIWAGYLWWSGSSRFFLVISSNVLLSICFLFYQVFYWNVWRRKGR